MSQAATPVSPAVPVAVPVNPGLSWLDGIFNFMFGMNNLAGRTRKWLLLIAFVLGVIFFAYYRHPWLNWEIEIIRLLPSYTPFGLGLIPPILLVVKHALTPFFHWDILSFLIAIILPYWISYKVSGVYLADIFNIFEIKDQRIADRFIQQAAFGSPEFKINKINRRKMRSKMVRIKGGMVEEQDTRSPIVRIGGPGNALVDLDSAALFEKIDGTPNVVGPTIDMPGQCYVLDGFERLRTTVDLRDQTLLLDNVTGRTSDGIRVTLKNVRLLSSIVRDAQPLPPTRKKRKENLHRPYPFSQSAIRKMVYEHGSDREVVANQTKIGVRMELLDFISKHALAEILSPVGQPDINQLVDLESQFESNPSPLEATAYIPRPQLTSLFYDEFKDKFAERIRNKRGVNLEWIDVGTWHIPADIIPENHMEAWRLTNENLAWRNQKVLDGVRHQATIHHLAGMAHAPLVQAAELIQKNTPADELVYQLVGAYHTRLRLAADSLISQGKKVPDEIETTIKIIDRYLKSYFKDRGYNVADSDPEAPVSG
jgi:hypothetical protein